MNQQNQAFEAAYGRVMFRFHLIEDLLGLHLFECGYFGVNGTQRMSAKRVRGMNHASRIDQFGKIYRADEDPNIKRLVEGLHSLRIIRNDMTHAFVNQVGTDFKTQEGIEQILAMLENIEHQAKGHLTILDSNHRMLLNKIIEERALEYIDREDPPFEASVSRSVIQKELDVIEARWRDASDESPDS